MYIATFQLESHVINSPIHFDDFLRLRGASCRLSIGIQKSQTLSQNASRADYIKDKVSRAVRLWKTRREVFWIPTIFTQPSNLKSSKRGLSLPSWMCVSCSLYSVVLNFPAICSALQFGTDHKKSPMSLQVKGGAVKFSIMVCPLP